MPRFGSPGPVAIAMGPFELRWYSILLATAAVLALGLAMREAERRGEDVHAVLWTSCHALAGGIVGARLLHVILEWDYYSRYPFRSLAIWEGGVSTFGGLLGALLATTAATRWSGLSLGQYVDTVTPGVPLGHAISRLGEFFNEEAFGRPTALPWGLYISPDRRPPGFAASEYFHPAFLYEAVWNAGVFGVTFFLLRKRLERMPGALFLAYLGLYALGRIPIEALRLDSVMVGPYRLGQVLAGGCLLAAGTGIPWVWWRRRASLRAASAGGGGGCHGP